MRNIFFNETSGLRLSLCHLNYLLMVFFGKILFGILFGENIGHFGRYTRGKRFCIITSGQHYYIYFPSLSAYFPPFAVEIETSLETFPGHLFLSLWCINSFRCGTDFSVCSQKKIK